MDRWICVEQYEMRGLPGQRVVIRDGWDNAPCDIIAVDYQVADLHAVADVWSRLCGLPVNMWPYDKPVQP